MELGRRIGVSTDSLFDVSFDEAIDLLIDAGFDALEIIPADFQGAGGFPYTSLNPGIWPRTCPGAERDRIRERLSCFSQVTVHAPHLGVDIGSRNPGIRQESERQYVECIEFAVDIGVRIVSFHHAGIEPSVQFARKALPYAHEHDLLMAFENGPNLMPLRRILEQIDDDRFGLLLDVGHAANGGLEATAIMDEFAARLVEIHASGVYRGAERYVQDGWGIDHFPFELNDAVDYPGIVAKLEEIGFLGPIVLEICYARCNDEIIEYCKSAKAHLVKVEKGLHSGSVTRS